MVRNVQLIRSESNACRQVVAWEGIKNVMQALLMFYIIKGLVLEVIGCHEKGYAPHEQGYAPKLQRFMLSVILLWSRRMMERD